MITARRSVARWAKTVAHIVTELVLTPVVLHLGPTQVRKLLDPAHPELLTRDALGVPAEERDVG